MQKGYGGAEKGGGKTIDLGRRMGAEVKPKGVTDRYYPSLHISSIPADSYFVKKGAGSSCSGSIELKIKSLTENSDGTYSVDLEARKLTPS